MIYKAPMHYYKIENPKNEFLSLKLSKVVSFILIP